MRLFYLTGFLCFFLLGSIDPWTIPENFQKDLQASFPEGACRKGSPKNVVLPQTVWTCDIIVVTAYSSSTNETDDTPFVASSGKRVHWGMVAANWLPFGTEVRLPDYFGDESFFVGDRMAEFNYYKLDIWHYAKSQAFRWGRKKIRIEVHNFGEFRCPTTEPTESIPEDMILYHGKHRTTITAVKKRLKEEGRLHRLGAI